MNTNEALQFYKEYTEKNNAYRLALTTISFDNATIAPKDGSDARIKSMSFLGGEWFDYQIDPENIAKLESMTELDLGETMNKEIKLVLKNVHKISKLPKDFYVELMQLSEQGEIIWKKAKDAKDYSLFKDTLKKLVKMNKKAYEYYGYETTIYDAMLDEYETGWNTEKYDAFFSKIKERLVPFISKVVNEGKKIDDSVMHQNFPEEGQKQVMDILKNYMGFNKNECYMGVSEHPFTCDFSLHDVRITTKYLEDSLFSSIFSIIHEYGHALYMLHVNPELEGLEVSRAMTSGMHESQSRFLENYIGKRDSFWVSNFSKVKEIFSEQLKDVTFEDFMTYMNLSKPSLIRTEADELTYPLHILIRYELEKEMINGTIDFDKLDEIWADKYEAYLGVRLKDASEGILQDIHWSGGSFGYFPTYALGSAFGAQFLDAMKKDIDIDACMKNNDFESIVNWLKDHIHQYGALYKADEIFEKVCHEPFDVNIYLDWLIEKYTKIYF